MHIHSFFTTAALALTANAFLLPPGIADDVQAGQEKQAEKLHNAVDKVKAKAGEIVTQIVDHNSHNIKLDCASCPFALKTERDGHHEWTDGIESDLSLHFAVKDNHLTLNGDPFYPVTVQEMPGALHARQVPKASSDRKAYETGAYEQDLKLSYTLEFDTKADPEHDTLVEVTMSIIGIDGQMVKIDDVGIMVNKHKEDGALTILDIKTVTPSTDDADRKCANMACRVMTKLAAAVAHARAKAAHAASKAANKAAHATHKVKCFCMHCFHRLVGHPTQPKPAVQDKTTKLPTHNVFRPGQFRPHRGGHHRRHGVLHSVMGFAKHLFTFVVLPVMVGVAVGITASAVGMLVGQAIVFIWLKLRGTRKPAYQPVQTDDKEDGLPAYEDEALPAYTAGEVVIVTDEKEGENQA